MNESISPLPGSLDGRREAIRLTSYILHKHYCENDVDALIDLLDDEDECFSWLGAAEHEYAIGSRTVAAIFEEFRGKVPLCNISNEHFDVIEPAPGADTIVAPADATVAATMPGSWHAIGLLLDDGMELLIHVGIDTVEMGGEGFACLVEQGQRVTAGQPLMTLSAEKIAAAGHPTITAFVVTGEGSATDLALKSGMDAEAGATTVATYRG